MTVTTSISAGRADATVGVPVAISAGDPSASGAVLMVSTVSVGAADGTPKVVFATAAPAPQQMIVTVSPNQSVNTTQDNSKLSVGSALQSVTGGATPYQRYRWSGGFGNLTTYGSYPDFQTGATSQFDRNNSPGTYKTTIKCVVTDANGVQATGTTSITVIVQAAG